MEGRRKSQWRAKYKSKSLSQATCRVCTLRSSMQGLVVIGLIAEEILNVNVKCVKSTGAQNIGQGHLVKIPARSVHLGEALCKVWWLEVLHLRRSGMLTSIILKSLQPKYRSRSPGQGICRVSTLRRSTLQGLMVVGLKVEEIPNVHAKCVKVTGAQHIAQGHQVKVPAELVHLGEATMQVLIAVGLIVEKIWNVNVNCVKVTGAQNIGQGQGLVL